MRQIPRSDCLDLHQICQTCLSSLRPIRPGMLAKPLQSKYQLPRLPLSRPCAGPGCRRTLESLVGTLVAILVGMSQKAQLPICFLDLAIRRGLLQTQYFVVGRRRAFPYSDHCRLLFDSVLAILIALAVFSTLRRASIGLCIRTRRGGRRHRHDADPAQDTGDRGRQTST